MHGDTLSRLQHHVTVLVNLRILNIGTLSLRVQPDTFHYRYRHKKSYDVSIELENVTDPDTDTDLLLVSPGEHTLLGIPVLPPRPPDPRPPADHPPGLKQGG